MTSSSESPVWYPTFDLPPSIDDPEDMKTSMDVLSPPKHHLWQKTKLAEIKSSNEDGPKPVYKLRITVVRDGEAVGGVEPRIFVFPSLHDLTHATNELCEAFLPSNSDDANSPCVTMKRAGVEAPNSEVEMGRGMAGFVEYVSIDYTSGQGESWNEMLEKLKVLEWEWQMREEGRGAMKL